VKSGYCQEVAQVIGKHELLITPFLSGLPTHLLLVAMISLERLDDAGRQGYDALLRLKNKFSFSCQDERYVLSWLHLHSTIKCNSQQNRV
jgi:hypothetical protein